MKISQRLFTLLCLFLSIYTFSGCTSVYRLVQDKELIANPKVNDIYAIQTSEFFNIDNASYPYCLARVTRVTDQYVYIIPSDESYKTKSSTLQTLRSNWYPSRTTNVDWLQNVEVKVPRSKLASDALFETRRLTDEQVLYFITNISARPIK